MKNSRVKYYRGALDALVESLEAVLHIARWQDATAAVPEELRTPAAKLLDRLGTANRLVTDTFAGNPTDVAQVNVLRGAMKRLDSAYVAYRQPRGGPATQAASVLEAEIGEVKLAYAVAS